MTANFQDGRSRNISLPWTAAGSENFDLRSTWHIWACRQFSWCHKYNISIQISSIWPPISKMAAMGYPKILSFTLKITAESQISWFCKTDMCTYNVYCNFKVINTNKYWLVVFNMVAIFPRWPPWAILNHYSLPQSGSRQSKIDLGKIIYTEL